jgi:hypothetical protein
VMMRDDHCSLVSTINIYKRYTQGDDVDLSDVRYYLASSPGPIRSRCAYAGAPPCGKPQGESTRIRRTRHSINHQVALPLSSYYLTGSDRSRIEADCWAALGISLAAYILQEQLKNKSVKNTRIIEQVILYNVFHKRAAHPSERRSLPTRTPAQRQHVMSQQHQASRLYTEADVQLAISDLTINQIQSI